MGCAERMSLTEPDARFSRERRNRCSETQGKSSVGKRESDVGVIKGDGETAREENGLWGG